MKGHETKLDTGDLKRRIDLREVVEIFWGKPDKRSRAYVQYRSRWRSDDRNPSFTVYESRYCDFGDPRTEGDVYDWLKEENNWDFKTALEWVYEWVEGSSAPVTRRAPPPPVPDQPADLTPSQEWQQAALEAVAAAETYLWSGKADAGQVLEYLRTVRGLSDETIREHRLGYNPRPRRLDLIDPESGKWIGLMPGIVIPWWVEGILVAVRLRRRVGNLAEALGIAPETNSKGEAVPKYTSLKGSRLGRAVYSGDVLLPNSTVLIVEGEFDQMLAQQLLIDDVIVVTKGSVSARFTQDEIIRLDAASQVYSLFDNDKPSQKLAPMFEELGWKYVPLKVPQGKDVTEFVVDHHGDLPSWWVHRTTAWWPGGVPDSVRTLALNGCPPTIAVMLELINAALEQQLLHPDKLDSSRDFGS